MDSQHPGCVRQAALTLQFPCAIVESLRRHKHILFANIASLCSQSIKRRQWKHNLDYYGIVFAVLATGCGINAKDPSGLDSDRWIPHSRCCENIFAPPLSGIHRSESSPLGSLATEVTAKNIKHTFNHISLTMTNMIFICCKDTVGFCYNVLNYKTVLHTLQKKHWTDLNSQKIPHTLSSQASYDVSIVSILEKNALTGLNYVINHHSVCKLPIK